MEVNWEKTMALAAGSAPSILRPGGVEGRKNARLDKFEFLL